MEIVLDACTLVAGILVNGTERRILEMIDRNEVTLVLSRELLVEYCYAPSKFVADAVGKAVNAGKPIDIKRATNSAYRISAKVADIVFCKSRQIKVLSTGKFIKDDPADDKLINLAIDADVQYIVSINDHLFNDIGEVKTRKGKYVSCLSPYGFTNLMKMSSRAR